MGLTGFDRASRWMFTTKASGAFTFGFKPSKEANATAYATSSVAALAAIASAKASAFARDVRPMAA